MKNHLNEELAKYIFASIGCVTDKLGTLGLFSEQCKTNKKIDFESEGNDKFHVPIYSGKLSFGEFTLKALFVDLTYEHVNEFCLVFRIDENPIYGLKYLSDSSSEETVFKIRGSEEFWIEASLATKCKAVIGFESLMSHGIPWQNSEVDSELRLSLESLISL